MWINVKDEFPPFETPLLFYHDDIEGGKYMTVGMIKKEKLLPDEKKYQIEIDGTEWYFSGYTHWMPLPKGPDEVD